MPDLGRARLILYYLDEHGNPVATSDSSKAEACMGMPVAHTLMAFWEVSTVFIAVDQAFILGLHMGPLVFETLALGEDGSEIRRHYATWDEAAAGHEAIVEQLLSGEKP